MLISHVIDDALDASLVGDWSTLSHSISEYTATLLLMQGRDAFSTARELDAKAICMISQGRSRSTPIESRKRAFKMIACLA